MSGVLGGRVFESKKLLPYATTTAAAARDDDLAKPQIDAAGHAYLVAAGGGGGCPRERGVGVWVAWEAWPKKLPRLPTTLNKVVPLPAGKVWMVRAVVRASKMVCPITFPEGK